MMNLDRSKFDFNALEIFLDPNTQLYTLIFKETFRLGSYCQNQFRSVYKAVVEDIMKPSD